MPNLLFCFPMSLRPKPVRELTLHDRLARLSHAAACKLLGPGGSRKLLEGGKIIVDPATQVELTEERFQLRMPLWQGRSVSVLVECDPASRGGLRIGNSPGPQRDLYAAAALAFILEEKQLLGLAAPPKDERPFELLTEAELETRALRDRAKRAAEEPMLVKPADAQSPWSDYSVTSRLSGKTYRVALRGFERGESYCTCPDFRTNTLGTCKHVIKVQTWSKQHFPARQLTVPPCPTEFALAVNYVGQPQLRLLPPMGNSGPLARLGKPLIGRALSDSADVRDVLNFLSQAQSAGVPITVYPDAEELIGRFLHRERLAALVADIRRDPAAHPLRKELLKTALLPYQLDGIAFAAGAGRAILADDMGLGKTIQGIGVAKFLRREAGVRKVLIVCPATLKSQWAREIERFSGLTSQQVFGASALRHTQYAAESFFTICNYEQVLRDFTAIEQAAWGLIILDEGQRIKNWEAKTARVLKALRSPFALVLSGTPLENRLDDLYSVVEFVDGQRLGPAFRFFHAHRVVDDKGKVTGYKNLDRLREQLRPILLRRTRAQVQKDLPPRTTEIVRIVPTDEQLELHGGNMRIVSQLLRKAYFTEMDLLRLRQALLMCRLAANSTALVDKQHPGYSSKLERLAELLADLREEGNRKLILFSEWTGMLDLVEPLLRQARLKFVRLDGKVPQRRRQQIIDTFQTDAGCHAILLTNAGATGLNLQAANTVINLDLPWNPAVLEQRIARAHRLGQTRPVQVYLLVSEQTIEENLLGTLSAKKELALAALDVNSAISELQISSNVEEMRRRLETLLGAAPAAPRDASKQQEVAAALAQQREQFSLSAGQLLMAAARFMGDLAALNQTSAPGAADGFAQRFQEECNRLERDDKGRPRLTVTFPDSAALNDLAANLARLASLGTAK